MAFLHRLVEFKLNAQAYPTDAEAGIELDNRVFQNASIALNGGVQSTQSKRLPSLSGITLKGINKEQLDALYVLNDLPKGYVVNFTLAETEGEVTYTGTVNIEGDLVYNSQAGTVSLSLMSSDGLPFIPI